MSNTSQCVPVMTLYCPHGDVWDGTQCKPVEDLFCPHGEVFADGKCQDEKQLCPDGDYYDFTQNKCVKGGCADGFIIAGHDRKNYDSTNHCSTSASDKDKFVDCYDCFLGKMLKGNDDYCCGSDDFLKGNCTVLPERSW